MGLRRYWHEQKIESIERVRQNRLAVANYVLESAQGRYITDTARSSSARDRIHAINTAAYRQIAHYIGHGAVAPMIDREEAVSNLMIAREHLLSQTPPVDSRLANGDVWAGAGIAPGSSGADIQKFFDPLVQRFQG